MVYARPFGHTFLVSGSHPARYFCPRFSVFEALARQKLPGWRPVPTITSTTIIFFCFGAVFIILGIIILVFSNKIEEISHRYDNDVECISEEDDLNIYCNIEIVDEFKEFLEIHNLSKLSYRIVFHPTNVVKIEDGDVDVSKFVDNLYEIDDVSYIYTNIEDYCG